MVQKINFPMYQDPPILEADISFYNADYRPYYASGDKNDIIHFNFDSYRAMGGRKLTMRGGVSASGVDFELPHNMAACDDKQVWFDIYNFIKLWKNLDKQASIAKDVWDMAIDHPYFIPKLWLDIETNDDLNKTTMASNAEKLINRIINKGVPVEGIYTRGYFWDANFEKTGFFKDFALWIAHWWTGIDIYKVPTLRPYLPDEWADINNPVLPIKWQVDTHDDGRLWGSMGDNEIDINMFVYNGGTYAAFEDYYGVEIEPVVPEPPIPPEPPEPPEPEPDEYWATQMVDSMSIRNEPRYVDVSDPNGTLFGKGMLSRKVKVLGEAVDGYVPVEAWMWKNSLREI